MKQKFVKIEIKNPCQQNRNAMPQVTGGLHCSQCAKVVTDFTGMNDDDLIRFFTRKDKPETCGFFHKQQLDKIYFIENHSQKQYRSLSLLLAGLLSLPLISPAQHVSQKDEIIKSETLKKSNLQSHTRVIKGRVINRETHKGIKASLQLFANNSNEHLLTTIYTDSTGHYELLLPEKGLARFFRITYSSENYLERTVVIDKDLVAANLNVSLLALTAVEVTVSPQPSYQGNTEGVNLAQQKTIIMGASFGSSLFTEKPSLPKRIWYKLRFVFRKIFR